SVQRRANQLWTTSFSMPIDDPKNELCNYFNFVEFIGASGRNYGLYRIMPKETRKSEGVITYQCEHVLATLLDDVIDGYLQFTNYTTEEVINDLLKLQTTKNWVLKRCDFKRYFHYSFENENGLLAPLFSIPKPFDEPYLFTFDTTVYPWELSLVRPSDEVMSEIRWGKDMMDFNEVIDPTDIVNYIIPKGAGEGVNQLTIESVNGGKNYLKDDASIAEWGVHKYIWIDQRFEDAESLKANAQSLLNQWKDPKISFECPSTDLSILPEYSHEQKFLYGVTRIIVEDKEYLARIVGESISDILGKEHEVTYEINNKLDDIAVTQADIERRIQVNEAYSQGATNILNFTYQDNCDQNTPALIPIYIDDDVVNVNTCELTFRTKKFRAYSRATKGGGAIVKSTSAGGGVQTTTASGGRVQTTTASGGGTVRTTKSGGGSTRTSSSNGIHRHRVFQYGGTYDGNFPGPFGFGLYYAPRASDGTARGATILAGIHEGNIYTDSADGSHTHTVNIPNHSHEFEVPNHTHNITLQPHTHNITLQPHTHDIELPDHTHEIDFGIYELNETPSNVEIRVDGNKVDFSGTSGDRIDLIPYLAKDESGRITRGRHEITIHPNALARIEADVILRVFIRSKLGGVY
ncbi:MAG: phage tail spike protein, partial [Caldibacillus sp.]